MVLEKKKKNPVAFGPTAVVRVPRTWGVYKPLQRCHWFLKKKKKNWGAGGYSVTFDSTAVVRAPRTWGVYKPLQRYHWFLRRKKKKGVGGVGWAAHPRPLSRGWEGPGGDAASGLGCMGVLIPNIVYTFFFVTRHNHFVCVLVYVQCVLYCELFSRNIETGQKFLSLFFGFFCCDVLFVGQIGVLCGFFPGNVRFVLPRARFSSAAA